MKTYVHAHPLVFGTGGDEAGACMHMCVNVLVRSGVRVLICTRMSVLFHQIASAGIFPS